VLRILHVVSGLSWRFGGLAASVLTMTDALARTGRVVVEIATTTADGSGGCLRIQQRPRPTVPCHWFRRDAIERWKFSLGLGAWLAAHAADYDLLHVHALWTFSTTAACWAARRVGVPYILTPHGMLSDYSFARGRQRKQLYWQLLERSNVRHAARIHVTSQSEADDLAALDVATRPAVVPLGLPEEAWTTPARPTLLRERCGVAAGTRPILLCLGRLHPIKGIVDVLLPAMASLRRQAFLALVGGPDEHEPGYGQQVRREILRLGLERDVALLGPVAGPERYTIFDGAELLVLPSHYESFGLVAAEAMARGVPVIISDRVKIADHVRAAPAGRIVPLNPAALAQACQELLADGGQRRQLGGAGRTYVQQYLHWPRVAQALVDLYEEVKKPEP
jgi:glycosyltransferase involved in cell wall biosynthesis